MGDHGLRMGAFRQTKIGAIEDKNPALYVILPENLRKNERIVKTLQENSQQLISHFDLYATFLDIARVGSELLHIKNFRARFYPKRLRIVAAKKSLFVALVFSNPYLNQEVAQD